MRKIILAPDSFKGTMSSQEICDILAQEIKRVWPQAQVVSLPVADGGEGSVDAFLAAVGGEKVAVPCKGPHWEDIHGFYGLLPDGTAVVEMAAAAGLPLVGQRLRPDQTTTYGVGQLVRAAVCGGARRLVVGLGGSATNDGGAGMAAALGVRFFRVDGEPYIPTGGTLDQLARVDRSGLEPALASVELTAMCDIDNPLCGPTGASEVFGPQKGAGPDMVPVLDRNLGHLADIMAEDLGRDLRDMPGAGAAGGLGFGVAAFFGGRLQMGIETVLDVAGFDHLLQGAWLVITGEGCIDGQSLRGKVVSGVARRAKAADVPTIAMVGDIGEGAGGLYEQGVTGIFSINRVAIPFSQARTRSREDLRAASADLFRLLARMSR
ncbi:MAG: glycerate kinase [Oscillospiraceae bacterium]|jgi:glycerate kinase|nr:glycerate kinase [Oscillospiraceae bacterium]